MSQALHATDGAVAGSSRRQQMLDLVDRITDRGTFRPSHGTDACGAVAGEARVDGCSIMLYANDPSIRGGALSHEGCLRIVATIDRACERGVPVLGLWYSGGAALQQGIASLDGVARMFAAMTTASGQVPQISYVYGPAAGGAAYGPALTDVVVMTGEARVFVTGPSVVRSVTGQEVTAEQLGGHDLHGVESGVAHLTADTADEGMAMARRVIGLLGRPGQLHLDAVDDGRPDPGELLPESPRRAYDVRPLIDALLDEPALRLHPRWARNVETALGRLGGRTVGVIANNPLHRGGCLDAASGDKSARFVRMCDAFGVPLVVIVDVPGYLPGLDQERGGVVRRGAKLLHAFAAARVPRATLVTRKAYGGAYVAMNSRGLGANAVYAWPEADIGVMNARSAVDILRRRDLEACADQDERDALAERLAREYQSEVGDLNRAMELSVVDAVIEPSKTRRALAEALANRLPVRGRQRNIPL